MALARPTLPANRPDHPSIGIPCLLGPGHIGHCIPVPRPALRSTAEQVSLDTRLTVFRARQAERDAHRERCTRRCDGQEIRCFVLWVLDLALARDWHELTAAGVWLPEFYREPEL